MNNIHKKELLKQQFKKRKEVKSKMGKKIVSFRELEISFQPETFEWYREINGGAKCE
ncbi:TPA: hypothetical protein QCV53_001438 [Bacillus cereus]|nr:hypothetical protein [Bacillus cereus]